MTTLSILHDGYRASVFSANGGVGASLLGLLRDDPRCAAVHAGVTDDVTAAYNAAIAAGAKPLNAPEAQPWGQTVARIRDPNGRPVSLATPIKR